MMSAYSEFYLHYIGTQLYGVKRFIAESKRIGAQRTINFDVLNKLHFGDKILLAEHVKIPQSNSDGTPAEPKEVAMVFGWLRVSGLTHNLPPEISKDVNSRLHIDQVFVEGGFDTEPEMRACGSYVIAFSASVLEDIPDICTAIRTVLTERGIPLQKQGFKFFVKGQVEVFENPIQLDNTPHTRSYLKVKLPTEDMPKITQSGLKLADKMVYEISDYSKRRYMKKDDGEAYDRALSDEFKEKMSSDPTN